MKKTIVFLLWCSWVCASSFSGMEHWYHPHKISLTGSGGSLTNVSSDVYNPACLWSLPRSFDVSFVSYPADINTQSVHLSLPGKGSVTVYGIRNVNYGLFEGKDSNNDPAPDYYASDTWFSWAAAGHSSRWPLAWGVNAGLFYSSIENKEAVLFTYSAGGVLTSRSLDAKLGFAFMNGGRIIKKYTTSQDVIPTSIMISVAKDLEYLPLTLSADIINRLNDNKAHFRFGGVFHLQNNIELKFGTSSNRIDQSTEDNFSKDLLTDTGFGIGWRYEKYHFESGFYSYGPGGWISGLAVGIQF